MNNSTKSHNGYLYLIVGNVLIITIALGIVLYQTVESRRKILNENFIQMNNFSMVVEEAVQSSMNGIEIVLDQFAYEVEKKGSVDNIVLSDLSHFRDQIGKIKSVNLNWADETGQLRWNSEGIGGISSKKPAVNVSDRDYFKFFKDNPSKAILVTEPLFGKIRKSWVVAIVKGLRSKNGKFLGVAWGSISNEYFIDLKNKTHLSENDVFVVATGDPLKFFYRSSNLSEVVGKQFVGPKEARPVVSGMLHRGVYQVVSPVDGHHRISAFSKVGDLPMLVVVGRDLEAALSPWRKEAYSILGLSLFGISLSILFLVYFYISDNKNRIYQAQLLNSSKLAALGEMSGSIAHEINNPLMVIAGHVERMSKILGRTPINVDDLNYSLEKIRSTLSRVTNIIAGLRKISNHTESDFSLLEVDLIINEAIAMTADRYRTHGIQIISQLTLNGLKAPINETQLNQVLINLFNNSFDEIAGTKNAWVKIESLKVENKIRIIFTDSGKGIPKDIAEKIMTPFFTTKEAGKGTGLGLSISKEIIKKHGGRFWYNSDCPNTQFVIEIPIKEAQLIK